MGLPGTVVGQGRYVLAEKLCEVCRLPESTSQPQHLALPLPSQRWGVERLGCLVERFGNFIVLHHTSPICWCFLWGWEFSIHSGYLEGINSRKGRKGLTVSIRAGDSHVQNGISQADRPRQIHGLQRCLQGVDSVDLTINHQPSLQNLRYKNPSKGYN